MRLLRVSIVGLGAVGQWLAAAIHRRHAWLSAECGVDVALVSVATRRYGFVQCQRGFDIPLLLDCVASGRSPESLPGTRAFGTVLDGIRSTEFEVLAEASNTDPRNPQPALSHLLEGLACGRHVITSSKGACAAAALELLEVARASGVQCRMESTVMSGTPVLSTIREGLAGVQIRALRGILNGTANHILTLMAVGMEYQAALADARAAGYAEPDPTDDVDGHDVVAKARILAALGFGCTVPIERVVRRGIADVSLSDIHRAASDGCRLKLIATIEGTGNSANIRVEPRPIPLADALARVDGVMNGLAIQTDTVRDLVIVGPGAGLEQAGQGIFSDLAAVARVS